MKLMIQTSVISLITLAAANLTNAAMYPTPAQPCDPGNVTIPCETKAWDFGLEAILVKPMSGPNWNYGEYETTNAASTLFSHNRQNYDPSFYWGWRLEGSYHFNNGSDITINWTHIDEDDKPSVTDTLNTALVTPYIRADEYGATIARILGEIDIKHDAVNIEFGQLAHYGQNYHVRFKGGFQWARVDVDNMVDLLNNTLQTTDHYRNDSSFDGIGVRGGIDTQYVLGNGFSLEGKGAMAVLVGDLKSTALMRDDIAGSRHYWYHNQRAIVPAVEGLVDLRYTHHAAKGDFNIYVGWRLANYFDVVQTTLETTTATAADSDLTEVRTYNNNFGYHGPVIGLKWVGNM